MSMHYSLYWKDWFQILMGTTRGGSETERLVPSEEGRETMKQPHADYQVVPWKKVETFRPALP